MELTEARIVFLSDGPFGIRKKSNDEWELFFNSDHSEVVATCPGRHISKVAMYMNGLLELRRDREHERWLNLQEKMRTTQFVI